MSVLFNFMNNPRNLKLYFNNVNLFVSIRSIKNSAMVNRFESLSKDEYDDIVKWKSLFTVFSIPEGFYLVPHPIKHTLYIHRSIYHNILSKLWSCMYYYSFCGSSHLILTLLCSVPLFLNLFFDSFLSSAFNHSMQYLIQFMM